MGMYDDVKFSCKCPDCGTTVDSFQSKDGKCMLDKVDFWMVDNFYAGCRKCGRWIEYFIKDGAREPLPPPPELPITAYEEVGNKRWDKE